MPDTAYDITQPYLGLIKKYRPEPNTVDPETQKRIAKGNAVAEAFRLLLDYSGAKKGANVAKRDEPSNAIMGAVERYYQSKEKNKAEQRAWDQAEMGAQLKALDQENAQKFATETADKRMKYEAESKADDRRFTRERDGVQTMNDLAKMNQQREQFDATLAQNKVEEANRNRVATTQAETTRMRYANIRPYGTEKGIWISDPDLGPSKQVHIPDDKRVQVLSYIKSDPNVQEEIAIMKLQFGNIPPEQQAEFLLADSYSRLTPETRAKIRQFVGSQNIPTNTSQKPGEEFLFYKNLPAQPTIKKDKSSKTMLTVQEPEATQPANPNNDIFTEASQLYSKAESVDQLQKDLITLINTRFPDASPDEKAGIYNDWIKRF